MKLPLMQAMALRSAPALAANTVVEMPPMVRLNVMTMGAGGMYDAVMVAVAVAVIDPVDVGVMVPVTVLDGVMVAVAVVDFVGVDVPVNVSVGVIDGVFDAVPVDVGVRVGVPVLVGVQDGVSVAVLHVARAHSVTM